MENFLLTIDEVAVRFRASTSTIRRWLLESKKGLRVFPFPCSPPHSRILFRESDIQHFIESQSQFVYTPPVSCSKQKRRVDKDFKTRQERARLSLEQHRPK